MCTCVHVGWGEGVSRKGRACVRMQLYFCCDVSAFSVFPTGPRARLLNSIHHFTLISEKSQCLLLDA